MATRATLLTVVLCALALVVKPATDVAVLDGERRQVQAQTLTKTVTKQNLTFSQTSAGKCCHVCKADDKRVTEGDIVLEYKDNCKPCAKLEIPNQMCQYDQVIGKLLIHVTTDKDKASVKKALKPEIATFLKEIKDVHTHGAGKSNYENMEKIVKKTIEAEWAKVHDGCFATNSGEVLEIKNSKCWSKSFTKAAELGVIEAAEAKFNKAANDKGGLLSEDVRDRRTIKKHLNAYLETMNDESNTQMKTTLQKKDTFQKLVDRQSKLDKQLTVLTELTTSLKILNSNPNALTNCIKVVEAIGATVAEGCFKEGFNRIYKPELEGLLEKGTKVGEPLKQLRLNAHTMATLPALLGLWENKETMEKMTWAGNKVEKSEVKTLLEYVKNNKKPLANRMRTTRRTFARRSMLRVLRRVIRRVLAAQ